MSTTRMMILGLVQWLEPVHGYDVRRELLSWRADEWANVQPGSVYHALRKMAEEGLLTEVATERVGARPARTTYRITPKGRDEFADLLRRYWWEYQSPTDPFAAALAFLPALRRADAVAALRNRVRLLTALAEGAQSSFDGEWMTNKPQHVRWMFERMLAFARAEIAWAERVAGEVEGGAGEHVDDPGSDLVGRWREQLGLDRGENVGESSKD